MHKKKRKILFLCLEIISLAILTPILYLCTTKLLACPIEYYIYGKISIRKVFFIILGFDTVWIITMIICRVINIHVKIFLTLLVLILSASVLVDLLVIDSLSAF